MKLKAVNGFYIIYLPPTCWTKESGSIIALTLLISGQSTSVSNVAQSCCYLDSYFPGPGVLNSGLFQESPGELLKNSHTHSISQTNWIRKSDGESKASVLCLNFLDDPKV